MLGKTPKLYIYAAIIIVVVAVASIGSYYWFFIVPQSPAAATVRVGWLTGDLHQLAYFVAKNTGAGGGKSFFEKYNINVTDALPGGYFAGGSEMDAFAKGEVDIGYLGSPPAITKHLNLGVNTTIVTQVNKIGSALVTKQPINSLSDLTKDKGKKIATPGPPSIQYFLFLRLVEKEELSIENFDLITLAPKDMRAALEAGTIDAFIAWEPFCADAVVNGVGVVFKNSSDIWPDHICCVVAVDKTFAVNHPNIVTSFLKAHIEATNWINAAIASGPGSKNYDLLLDIAANFTGRNRDVIEFALANINYTFDIDDRFMGVFIEFAYKLIEYKIVAPGTIEDRGYSDVYDFAHKYIDTSYLTEAKR